MDSSRISLRILFKKHFFMSTNVNASFYSLLCMNADPGSGKVLLFFTLTIFEIMPLTSMCVI